MDFVLLGTSRETLPFIRTLNTNAVHRLVAYWTDTVPSAELSIVRRLSSPTESLLIGSKTVLLVNSTDSAVLDVVRQSAASGVPIGIWPKAAHGIEFIYQLGLIRDEQPDQFRILSMSWLQQHPYFVRLSKAITSNSLGRVLQLSWNRRLAADSQNETVSIRLMALDQVRDAFLGDSSILSDLVGPFQQIAVLEASERSSGVMQSTVDLAGSAGIAVNWSCLTADDAPGWSLILRAEAGVITVSGDELDSVLTWNSTISGDSPPESMEVNPGLAQLQLVTEWLGSPKTIMNPGVALSATGSQVATRNGHERRIEHGMQHLLNQYDLLEGYERSLRRRRTVDLYSDVPSERSNFKSQMTALGCMVLLLTLVTIPLGLLGGAIAKELGLPAWIMKVIRVLVFLPLFLFLVLQVGLFLARPSSHRKDSD